ncbi:MAG: potassium channel protein [Myxococcales bacterium]|nr:potassium channel protein [Myxococcales bacterium]
MTARILRRARLAVVGHVLGRLGRPLAWVVAYTIVATIVTRFEMRRAGANLPDVQQTAYGLFTQLFMEPTEPFPPTPVARLLFWITPLVGAFLIAQGLLKVGASLFDLGARREMWVRIVSDQMRDHVVVCGLGHVGYRVVEELHALGVPVLGIERHDVDSFVAAVRDMGIPVHVGDARRDELLLSVGVQRARAVVCATNDDMANLEIALDAKRMNPQIRVVLRMFDQRVAAKVGGALELDESFSTSALAAPLIALQATQEGVLSAYRLGGALRVTAELTVAKAGTVSELEARSEGFRVVGRHADTGLQTLRSGDKVREGDVLVVDAEAERLGAVRRAV